MIASLQVKANTPVILGAYVHEVNSHMETCLGLTTQSESPGDFAKGKIDLGI